jgi:hypothetical protein
LIGLGAVLLCLAALLVWIWRPRPAMDSGELVQDRQTRLLGWGARLGQPLRDGQTAHEYSEALGQTLRHRGQHSRLLRSRKAAAKAPEQVQSLTNSYVRTQYSPGPIDPREGYQVRELWPRLRRHLWWLWLSVGRRTDRDLDHLD